ncbi:MAG: glycine--tRNA ligase subunit beta [Rhodobacteraceae bacterium]|nr:glycine--tRNA ligase subunit beta [Paracoccaceae bacterium]
MPDLLIELFSEEIPARMQARAADDLKRLVTDGIVGAGLTYAGAAAFATPRRLTLAVEGMTAESPTRREERKGPKVGAPEAALDGFCRSAGVAREALEARDAGKGQVWFATIVHPGRPAAEIVAEVLGQAVRAFPWPKSMRWGEGDLRWVRPLHSILCIVTDEAGARVVPLEIGPLGAGNVTRGHRFMAPRQFPVVSFDDYVARLKRAHVVLDQAERADRIRHDAEHLAFALGLEIVEDRGLLAEVAGLVEWPVVLMGEIEERFRHLPAEVLQTSMRTHQKFFSVRKPDGEKLAIAPIAHESGADPAGSGRGAITHFITVANRETADHGATILAGNRKVLAARLSDAAFFWERDLAVAKAGMEEWLDGLGHVTFHAKLGTQKERIDRIAALARELAPAAGADQALAGQAARVAKADLRSEMVGEFPELQGVMGRYYALQAGMDPQVAAACAEHYAPLGPSDAVPTAPVSVAVALADKIDLLTGFWAIDEKPTGSKDPFALRRAALGVIRLVLENNLRIRMVKGLSDAVLRHMVFATRFSGFDPWVGYGMEDPVIRQVLAEFIRGPKADTADIRFIFQGIKEDYMRMIAVNIAEFGLMEVDESNEEVLSPDQLESRSDFIREQNQFVRRVLDFGEYASLRSAGDPDEVVKPRLGPTAREYCIENANDVLAFLHDRLKVFLRDRGIPHDVIDACLHDFGSDVPRDDADDLTLLVKRAEALAEFLTTEDGENLIQGFKRANNILAQAEAADGVEYSFGPEAKLAESDDERALFAALESEGRAISSAIEAEDFASAMRGMASLRAPIDAFFESVVVNSENAVIRRNRLNLLHLIRTTCLSVADLTRLQG